MTASEGRKFALTLIAGFAALAAIALWRHRPHSAQVFAGIAFLVLLAGVFVPSKLGPVSHAWTGFGEALSHVTSPIIFGVIYYIVFTPIGALRRSRGSSPLVRSPDARTFWATRSPRTTEEAREAMEHLF